ncbi:MAG: hypothetical protein PF483_11880 [Halothiobacillus sp.]|jgi:hypothetical protein|nr:hypothetical protein [Halothiobacillus sp.]
MRPFERKSFHPVNPFGLDSIQGYLELAEWYSKKTVTLSWDPKTLDQFGSMYWQLRQLEQEGLVVAEWAPRESSEGRETITLNQIALTITGQKLLGELRAKSPSGKLKERLVTLLWVIIASLFTTLVVLAIK